MRFYDPATLKKFNTPALVHLDYDFDIEYLKVMANHYENLAEPWEGGNNFKTEFWKIYRLSKDTYINEIMEDLNINAHPRFVYQSANTYLSPHIDFDSKCCVNILLSDDPAPINIEDIDYEYSAALINIERVHSVRTDDQKRVFLKLSVKDKDFDQVLKEIRYVQED
jgi:hypothetical protein